MVTFNAQGTPGTSQLPAARVRRIIKEDKDIFACGADSIFLIAKATEFFIDSLARESFEFSRLDKRKTVQYKDMAKAVQSIEQYDFLADIIPPTISVRRIIQEEDVEMEAESAHDVEVPAEVTATATATTVSEPPKQPQPEPVSAIPPPPPPPPQKEQEQKPEPHQQQPEVTEIQNEKE